MLSKFSECGVFASRVDYFCLVCECRLRDESDAAAHIVKPVHTKKFNSTEYFGNEQEYVRKIKKWYLCELCNLVLPTAARVRLHILESTHVANRNDRALQRKGSYVIAFSSVQVDDRAWNGIVDDTCAICNTEFDNERIHRNETNHILKLIQSKVEFDENQNLYRQVDESSFHCLTCNTVFSLSSIDKHFCEIEHKNLYQHCSNNFKIGTNTTTLESVDIPNDKENIKNHDEKEVEVVTKVPDATSETSTPSNKEKNILSNEKGEIETSTLNSNAIKSKKNEKANDVQQFITIPAKFAPIDDTEICEILNAKDYITVDENGKTWCILCNWVIFPFAIRNHINDLHHQTMLQMHKKRLSTLNKNLNDHTPVVKKENDTIKTKENVKNDSILHSMEKFQKNNIYINFEIETASCKKCSKQLDFNSHAIEEHIQEHAKIKNEKNDKRIKLTSGSEVTKNEEPGNRENSLYTKPVYKKDKQEQKKETVDSKKNKESSPTFDLDELEKYAKQNYMTYIPDENKVYCKKCNTNITPSLKALKEHIEGVGHKKKLNEEVVQVVSAKSKSKQTDKGVNLLKIPINSFIKTAVSIDSLQKEIVINEKITVSLFSLALIVNENNRFNCLLCECNVFMHNFEQHVTATNHENLLNRSLVVIELDNELIREFKPGCYHCGYCNLPCSSWDAMESHLQTVAHKECRTAAEWRLQQLLPEIARHRLQKQMHENFMMHMFSNMFGGWNRSYDSDSD